MKTVSTIAYFDFKEQKAEKIVFEKIVYFRKKNERATVIFILLFFATPQTNSNSVKLLT